MPHWAWVALAFGLIVALFAFLLRVGRVEPRDRWNDSVDHLPDDFDHHPDDGGGHH